MGSMFLTHRDHIKNLCQCHDVPQAKICSKRSLEFSLQSDTSLLNEEIRFLIFYSGVISPMRAHTYNLRKETMQDTNYMRESPDYQLNVKS